LFILYLAVDARFERTMGLRIAALTEETHAKKKEDVIDS